MLFKINERLEQPFLDRVRVVGEVVFEKATPSYAEVAKELAGQFKLPEDAVAVQHVYTSFGMTKAKVIANVYNSKDSLIKFEPKKKEKKAKPGEAGAEAPKAEAK